MTDSIANRQIDCGVTRTTPQTHKIIADNLQKSSVYSGQIEGVGPRYCPSIEDKIVKFGERDGHQIFLEQAWMTTTVYPNGISTSLPAEVRKLSFIPFRLNEFIFFSLDMPSNMIMSTLASRLHRWKCGRCKGCFWLAKSMARPATRRRRHRDWLLGSCAKRALASKPSA